MKRGGPAEGELGLYARAAKFMCIGCGKERSCTRGDDYCPECERGRQEARDQEEHARRRGLHEDNLRLRGEAAPKACSIAGCERAGDWRLWAELAHGHQWMPFCAVHRQFVMDLDRWEREAGAGGGA